MALVRPQRGSIQSASNEPLISKRATATMQTIRKEFALTVLALSLLLFLAACSSKEEKKPTTQVAAKVNAEEISVHQINFVLGRSGAASNITPEQAPIVRREILDKLVDQQLAVEQALDKKLDRSPDVLMALEAGRREILARAYVEQLAAGLSMPTAAEVKTYYTEHPQLFSERRVFNIQEIIIPTGGVSEAGQLREMVATGKPMDEIANWLKGKNIKFASASATRPAEQVPLELLPKVHALKDGQGLVLENGPNVSILRVVTSQSSPIAEAAALPRIQQYLGNQRAAKAVAAEFKALKAKAKIEYQGEFAGAAAAPVAAVPAATTPAAAPSGTTVIEKGVAALK